MFMKLVVIIGLSCVSDRETVDVAALSANIRIIAESTARQIYNLTEADMPQLFTDGLVGSCWFSNHCCLLKFFIFEYNLYHQVETTPYDAVSVIILTFHLMYK